MPLQFPQIPSALSWARSQNVGDPGRPNQKRLTFRDVFTSVPNFWCLVRTVCVLIVHANPTKREDLVTFMAA